MEVVLVLTQYIFIVRFSIGVVRGLRSIIVCCNIYRNLERKRNYQAQSNSL